MTTEPTGRTRSDLDSPEGRPRIVALCGSTRFWAELQEAVTRETAAGKITLAPGCNMKQPHLLWDDARKAEDLKARLDTLHRHKIDLADEVLIVAPGGYIGESTRSEIQYAQQLGRPIRYSIEAAPSDPDSAVLAEALALVRDLHQPEPCHLDHHGYCQEHGWTDTDCPHARAAQLLHRLDNAPSAG
ncbi:hypothetical protein [Streptomyces sp. NPDC051561]|uniref:hypothetical protein n=1 Tax=Streptomyces sp. NPDC051561 TaxID=3365658 RepID=UPI00379B6465